MNLISVENVAVAYGVRQILEGAQFGLNRGEKVALVGPNGSGKSTLVRLILGREQPDTGRVSRMNGLKMATLDQNPEFQAGHTLLQAVLWARPDILKALNQWKKVIASEDMEQMASLQEELERMGAWQLEDQARASLKRLGFEDENRRIEGLSGGERKKLALARLFFEPAELLILDEPTNHLDVDSIEWLEERLKAFEGSVLLITHDRYFLENICTRILEIHRHRIYSFEGNYSDWLEARALRDDIEDRTQQALGSFLKRELEWVRRQPRARGTKSKSRLERFDDARQKVERSLDPLQAFQFTLAHRLGNIILEWGQLGHRFEGEWLFQNSAHKVLKGERIGIVGPNGAGKSTFLRIATSQLEPVAGHVKQGQNTVFSFLSQDRTLPVPGGTVMEQIRHFGETAPSANGRMGIMPFLERFGFSGDTWTQKAAQLSGGERARLLMACMVAQGANFLILDEPTNDLDLDSMRLLEEALIAFEGAAFIVSHDRWFLDRVATTILEIGVTNPPLITAGNFSIFKALKEASQSEAVETSKEVKAAGSRPERRKKLFGFKEQKELEEVEIMVSELELRVEALNEALVSDPSDYEACARISAELTEAKSLLDEKIQRWAELEEMKEEDLNS